MSNLPPGVTLSMIPGMIGVLGVLGFIALDFVVISIATARRDKVRPFGRTFWKGVKE